MAERPRLEAVLFDAGGTLVRLDFEWMAAAVTELGAPLDAATLRRAEVAGRRSYDARHHAPRDEPSPLGGGGAARDYFAGMLAEAAIPPAVIERALVRFRERHEQQGLWTRPMEGARAALEAIGELGLRRAVVSNSDGRAEQHLRDCDVLTGIEFVVDSHRVGIEKPDAGIFRIALERMSVAAAALYVGDIRSVDELGARAAGTGFVLIDPFGDYAPPGGPSIPAIDQLAGWIVERFTTPARPEAERAHGPAPSRAAKGANP